MLASGGDYTGNVAIDTQTPGVSRVRAMWRDRWNNDPGYFTAQKKPPGAANYFRSAWDNYNTEDYMNGGEASDQIAIMRDVCIEKSKDFAKGFTVEGSLDYDASTLKKDPQLPKYETYDGEAKGIIVKEVEDADDDAVPTADAMDAGSRLVDDFEAGWNRGEGKSKPMKQSKLKPSGRVSAITSNPKAPSEAPSKPGKFDVSEEDRAWTALEEASSVPSEKKKVQGGSESLVGTREAEKGVGATKGRPPSKGLSAGASENFGISPAEAKGLSSNHRKVLNLVAEGRQADSRGKGFSKGDLEYPADFWAAHGHEDIARQHETLLKAVFKGHEDILGELKDVPTGDLLSLSKEGRSFFAQALTMGEKEQSYDGLSDFDIKTLLNILEDYGEKPTPNRVKFANTMKEAKEFESSASAGERRGEKAERRKAREVLKPSAKRGGGAS